MAERKNRLNSKHSKFSRSTEFNEASLSSMEKSTLAKGSSNYNPRNLKHHIFNRSDFEYEYHNEGQIVRENLFGESDEDDSYNEAVRGSSPTAAKYNQPEMYQSEEYSRSSDTVKPSYMFHVNTRIWRNHLRLNYALRVFLILSIVVISLFTSFLKLRYVDYKAGHTYKYNFGPIFFSLDGSWHFVAEIYYCQPHIFPGEF